jgi:hypothetical protein
MENVFADFTASPYIKNSFLALCLIFPYNYEISLPVLKGSLLFAAP